MADIGARESQNAVIASLGIHLGLVGLMVISVNWSWNSPVAIQAELWSSLPAIETNKPPTPEPPPRPDPKPVSPPTPSPSKLAPPEPSAADIALEKKKREQEKKAAELKREQDKKAEELKLAQKKAAEAAAAEKKAAEAREAEQREQERREAEQREQDRKEAERKEAERREAARIAQEKKLAEKRLREKQAAERLAAQRESELARLGLDPNAKAANKGKDIVSKAGVDDGVEQGSKTGELADYAAMIRARVLSRIRFDPALAPGNPDVIFLVEQSTSGDIVAVTKKKSSGVIGWDNAVERAIMAASPLPRKKDGSVEKLLELRFRPKEDR